MIRLVTKLSDRLLNRIIPGKDAQACVPTTYKVPCNGFTLRTGRCEMTCTKNCDGTVTCDNDCVC